MVAKSCREKPCAESVCAEKTGHRFCTQYQRIRRAVSLEVCELHRREDTSNTPERFESIILATCLLCMAGRPFSVNAAMHVKARCNTWFSFFTLVTHFLLQVLFIASLLTTLHYTRYNSPGRLIVAL